MAAARGRAQLVIALVIGLGLAVAPVAFQMFTRAPKGAAMIDEFGPYMDVDVISDFRGYLAQIDAAEAEAADALRPSLASAGTDAATYETSFPSAAGLNSNWQGIDDDMSDLLNRMDSNLDNFAAVKALPSFNLFPWFFLLPGLFIAGVAFAALRSAGGGGDNRRLVAALGALGVAVILAPAIFQMFSRAPAGGEMINDFRPMMTRERVVNVQGYFITLGAGEGELRNKVIPAAGEATGLTEDELAAEYPSITELSGNWPTIVGDFAPMIAAMSDNVDNYEAVDALPPFPLFPWFFVIPGVLVAGLAWSARRSGHGPYQPPNTEQHGTERTNVPTTQGAES